MFYLTDGLKLKTGELKDALKSFKALLWGVACILFVTPVIGGELTGLLPYVSLALPTKNGFDINGNHSTSNITQSTSSPNENHQRSGSFLGPALFQTAMQIYFIAPCTISAGVILSAQAGGAVALAVMLTVISNVTAVFTIPPLITWIIAFDNVQIDPIKLLIKLILTVLPPLLVGKSLRYVPRVKPFVVKYRNTLKMISIVLLSMVPWMKVSQASDKNAFSGVSAGSIFAVLAWGMTMHILFIVIILLPSLILKLEKPALKSVVIMASQKSMAVAVTVVGYLPFTHAQQGVISIPMIIIHLGILVSDSFLASYWLARDHKKQLAKTDVPLWENLLNADIRETIV
ncbi:hypothetical protein ACROYT_G011304 [Oculina patagonica]